MARGGADASTVPRTVAHKEIAFMGPAVLGGCKKTSELTPECPPQVTAETPLGCPHVCVPPPL
jgi:hypothetical protein